MQSAANAGVQLACHGADGTSSTYVGTRARTRVLQHVYVQVYSSVVHEYTTCTGTYIWGRLTAKMRELVLLGTRVPTCLHGCQVSVSQSVQYLYFNTRVGTIPVFQYPGTYRYCTG